MTAVHDEGLVGCELDGLVHFNLLVLERVLLQLLWPSQMFLPPVFVLDDQILRLRRHVAPRLEHRAFAVDEWIEGDFHWTLLALEASVAIHGVDALPF